MNRKDLLMNRKEEKIKSRQKDLEDLANGVSPEEIQRRNSILPKSFFEKAKIQNLAEAFGK